MNNKNHKINQEKPSGSLNNSEPEFLLIGRIRKPHGLKGEIAVDLYTDFPDRVISGKKIYIGENKKQEVIADARKTAKFYLLRLKERETIELVEEFRNEEVFILANQMPVLKSNQYYHHQLIGLVVVDQFDIEIGVLSEILETGANDVYIVRSNIKGEEILLPAIQSVILNIDIENKKMIVDLPAWC